VLGSGSFPGRRSQFGFTGQDAFQAFPAGTMKQLVDGFAPDVLFEALKLHINDSLIRFVEGVNQPGACLDYGVSRILETDPTPIVK
jgi:hypothetical protein